VSLALAFVPNEPLRLEVAEDREDGRIREVGGEAVADLGHGGGTGLPQDTHHIELAIAELGHGWLLLRG
jgi:hypothetical protein